MKNLKAKFITQTPESRLYHIPVPIIGLTGGIATGKSTVAQMLQEKNIPVIDADKLVKNIYQKSATLDFIARHFPHVIMDGEIVFKKLRETVFIDQMAKKLIEDYIYALLPEEFKKAFSAFPNPHFIVYDVPLLFEKGLDKYIDLSVCVYAPRATQLERLINRDNSSHELANKILNNQMDIEKKKEKADLVIENSGSLEDLKISVESMLAEATE